MINWISFIALPQDDEEEQKVYVVDSHTQSPWEVPIYHLKVKQISLWYETW